MKKRHYVIRQIDAEGEPVVDHGDCPFYVKDEDLVPAGFRLNSVQNCPKLKTIYIEK